MEGKIAKYATVISDSGERYECLNVASYNFLNFVGRADIEVRPFFLLMTNV